MAKHANHFKIHKIFGYRNIDSIQKSKNETVCIKIGVAIVSVCIYVVFLLQLLWRANAYFTMLRRRSYYFDEYGLCCCSHNKILERNRYGVKATEIE